jgi:hypothetical protein
MTTPMQSRDEPGRQIRARLSADAVAAIRNANLKPGERARVLEAVQEAITQDRHDEEVLGGARHLARTARLLDTPNRLAPVLDRLATTFVQYR